ncbi:unnamed protein product [Caenorhabditis sp. 36 PRJEB53466]|nr:unnamed protein product [Caenorhabditis sp. 36 PRJEB53466]
MERFRRRTAPTEIPDPEDFLYRSNSDTYSANMDKLFADDEKITLGEQFLSNSKEQEEKKKETSPTKPILYFTAAGFWKKNGDSQRIGVILNRDPCDEKLYFVIYNKEKTVLKRISVDGAKFEFDEEHLAVTVISDEVNGEEAVKVAFIDRNEFLRFSITALIRSASQDCFVIFGGSGDREISAESALLFDRIIHKTDENGLALPVNQKGTKTKLSAEKLAEHQVYRWMGGLRRMCHLMVKVGDEVHEVIVIKEKIQAPSLAPEPSELSESQNLPRPEDIPIAQEEEDPEETIVAKKEPVEVPSDEPKATPSPAPRTSVQPPLPTSSSEDVRDTLHRIVGIELDRIEMRLNEKFEQLQNNVLGRLDRQTELLEQLLNR